MTESGNEREKEQTAREFRHVVNMTASALQRWLDSDESKSVGMKSSGEKVTERGQGEAVGHHMGHVIVELHGRNAADWTDADYAAMRKVIGYVHRHAKQRPDGDVKDTRWRKSLMNWGHDPLK